MNIKPKWQTPLGVTESIVAYNCRKYGFPRSVLAMPFWEGAGNKVYDISGNMNHGTLLNGTKWSGGKFGNALSFDGVNDCVVVGNRVSLKPDFVSVMAWVKTSNGGEQTVFSQKGRNYGGWYAYALRLFDGKVKVRLQQTNEPSFIDFTGIANLNDGNWHQIGFTFDTDFKVHIYVDGKLDSISNAGSNSIYYYVTDIPAYIGIGTYNLGQGDIYEMAFNGLIDDVHIYNRALTPAQIKFSYDHPFFMYEMPEELWGYYLSGNLFFLHG